MPAEARLYPRLLPRALAASWDALFMVYGALLLLVIGDAFGVRSDAGKLGLMLAPFFIVDPLMVSLTGSSPGHRLYNLRVCRARDGGRLNLAAALLRFVLKFFGYALVWLPVLVSRRHQGVHDLLVGSLVLHRDPARAAARDCCHERVPDATHRYPPAWRRILVMAVYLLLASLLFDALGSALIGSACWDNIQCSAPGFLGVLLGNILYLLLLALTVIRGWGGRLYGARRQPLP